MSQDSKEIAKEDKEVLSQYLTQTFFRGYSNSSPNVKAMVATCEDIIARFNNAEKNLKNHENHIDKIKKRLENNQQELNKIETREKELIQQIRMKEEEIEKIDSYFKDEIGNPEPNYFLIYKAIRELSPSLKTLYLNDLRKNKKAKDGNNKTFLFHAIDCHNLEAASFFLENKIAIDNHEELLEMLLDDPKNELSKLVSQKIIRSASNKKFINCVRDNEYDEVKNMLERNQADVNADDDDGRNALLCAIECYDKDFQDTFNIMTLLIENGINIYKLDDEDQGYKDYLDMAGKELTKRLGEVIRLHESHKLSF
jgi:ankyrin repeat protein